MLQPCGLLHPHEMTVEIPEPNIPGRTALHGRIVYDVPPRNGAHRYAKRTHTHAGPTGTYRATLAGSACLAPAVGA